MHKALLCAFTFKFLVIKKKVRNKTVLLLNIHSHVRNPGFVEQSYNPST